MSANMLIDEYSPVKFWSPVATSKSAKWYRRMTEAMTQLHEIVLRIWHIKLICRTYNAPSHIIPLTMSFFLKLMHRVLITKSGRQSVTRSRTRLMPAIAVPKMPKLMVKPLRDGSQAAETGFCRNRIPCTSVLVSQGAMSETQTTDEE